MAEQIMNFAPLPQTGNLAPWPYPAPPPGAWKNGTGGYVSTTW